VNNDFTIVNCDGVKKIGAPKIVCLSRTIRNKMAEFVINIMNRLERKLR